MYRGAALDYFKSTLHVRDQTAPMGLGSQVFLNAKCQWLSHVRLFATPWTVAHQAPLSTGLSRQGYWSGLPFLPPGDLPNPGIEPRSPTLQADSLLSEPPGKPFSEFTEKEKDKTRTNIFSVLFFLCQGCCQREGFHVHVHVGDTAN